MVACAWFACFFPYLYLSYSYTWYMPDIWENVRYYSCETFHKKKPLLFVAQTQAFCQKHVEKSVLCVDISSCGIKKHLTSFAKTKTKGDNHS